MSRLGSLLPEVLKTLGKERATVDYPFEKREMGERFRGKLAFDEDACTGCSLCARNCPADALEVQPGQEVTWRYDTAQCLFCGLCVDLCPPGALESSSAFELASGDKDSFVEEYTFER